MPRWWSSRPPARHTPRVCVFCGAAFTRPHWVRMKFCSTEHWYEWKREQFLKKYEVDPSTGCWNFTGPLTAGGYGRGPSPRPGVNQTTAHRVFFERLRGPVPEGLYLDHVCRNRRCVNPDHLEPVTPAENIRRGASTSLTPDQVGEIRRLLSEGAQRQSIADRFGINKDIVARIDRGERWAGSQECVA